MATFIKKITVATPNRIPQVLTDINNLQGIDTSNETNNDILVFDSASGNLVARDSATLSKITVSNTFTPSGTIAGNLIPSADSTFSLGDSNSKWRSLHISGQTIFLGSLRLQDQGGNFAVTTADGSAVPSTSSLDSARAISLIDSSYIQLRQSAAAVDSALTTSLIDSAYIQARQTTTSPLNLGVDYIDSAEALKLIDANALDSARALNLIPKFGIDFIDSGAALTLIDANALDSARALNLIPKLGTEFVDSAETIKLIDANALDSARALNLIPKLGINFVDSNETKTLIDANALDSGRATKLIDSAYVRIRQDKAYSSLTGTPTIPTFGVDFVDSAYVTSVLPTLGGNFIDSAQALILIDANALDSGRATKLIDSAYVRIRQDKAYSSLTGAPTIPSLGNSFIDSAQALVLIDANALDSGRGQSLINSTLTNYVNRTQDTTFTSSILFNDNRRIKLGTDSDHVLYHDGSGQTRLEGSAGLKLEAGNDVFITTPSQGHMFFGDPGSSVRLYFNGIEKFRTSDSGTVVTGTIKVDSATIAGLKYPTSDGLGNQVVTTDGSGTLRFASVNALAGGLDSATLLALIDSAYLGNIVDSNFVAALITATGVNVQDEGSALPTTGATLNFVGDGVIVTGNGATKTVTISGGTVDSSFVLNNSIDSADALILIDANALDSGRAISLIDSAYVQARVTAGTDSSATIALIDAHALDSGRATSLIDSAYVQLRVTAGTDSATTIALIDEYALDSGRATKLIDSAYVRFRETPQDFAYASLTGKPTIPTFGVNFVDSGYVSGVLPKFGTDFVDSAATLILIDANALDSGRVIDLIDSSYIQLRQSATGGSDFIFKTIAVAGQSNVVADTTTDTLTLVGGDNVTITTDAASDTVTFTASVPRFGADFIDSAAALTLIDANALDSGRTTSLVDSSYVEARGLVKQTSIVLSSAGANQVVDTFSKTVSRTSKYMIEMKDSAQTDYHIAEVLLTHDGTTVYMTEYGIIKAVTTDSDLGTIDGDINSGNVRLKITTTRNNIKVSTSRISLGA